MTVIRGKVYPDSEFPEEDFHYHADRNSAHDYGSPVNTKSNIEGRYLRAMGRGVDVDAFALEYDASTHKLMTSGISKTEHQIQRGLEIIVDLLFTGGEMSPAEVKATLEREKVKQSVMGEASARGLVESVQDGRKTIYKLTDVGINLHHRRITRQETSTND